MFFPPQSSCDWHGLQGKTRNILMLFILFLQDFVVSNVKCHAKSVKRIDTRILMQLVENYIFLSLP
jgi:hypothetical protein